MKKVRKLLGLVLSAAMLASMIPARAAETSTRVYFEEFNTGATLTTDKAAEMGFSGGGSAPQALIAYGVLKLNNGKSIKKTFDTPYTGMVGITMDTGTTNSDIKNRAVEIGLKAEDGKDCVLYIGFGSSMYLRGADGSRLKDNNDNWWYRTDSILSTDNLLDSNNLKLVFTFGTTQNVSMTVSNSNGETTANLGKLPKNMQSVTYYKVTGLQGTGWNNHITFDNIAVWQKDIPSLPELTYVKEEFTDLSEDFFGGSNMYAGLKYYYYTDGRNRYDVTETTVNKDGEKLVDFSDEYMNVQIDFNDSSRRTDVIKKLPSDLTGLIDISFDAAIGDDTAQPAYISFYNSDEAAYYTTFASMHFRPNAKNLFLNHEYGSEGESNIAAGGATVAGVVKPGEFQKYRFVLDTENEVYDVYVDGIYRGCYNALSSYKGDDTKNISQMGFANVKIDNLVVKKAPMMYQYKYYGIRGDGTGVEDWNSQWTETSEPAQHKQKLTMKDFWHSEFGVKLTVSNPTELEKTAVLISAVYDENGYLFSVAMSDQKTLNTKTANGTELTQFDVKHSKRMLANMSAYNAKTFLWDTTGTLTPVIDNIYLD